MSMYDNAIDALICGVEDYQRGTEARYKSALRNVYSGLLLILKEKLHSMAPEMGDLMIAEKAKPKLIDGKVVWVAKGHKTVDANTIQERFKSLGIRFNWKVFNEISDVRNNIEHKYTDLKAEAVQELIAKAFVLLTEFMTNEMNLDIKDELGDSIYNVFVDIKEIYEAEKAKCSATWRGFKTESKIINALTNELFCPECASELVILNENGSLDCKFCNENFDREDVIEAFTQNHFGYRNYRSVKDGGDPGNVTCPVCDLETLVVEDLVCANCGESFNSECSHCSIQIPFEEIDGSGICSWCQRRAEKDD